MIEGFAFLKFIIFVAFLFFTAVIDQLHYRKKQWVTNKNPRWMQRLFFIIALSFNENIIFFVALSLLWMGLFDMVLNFIRKGITTWHLGQDSKWDRFWNSKPIIFYKIARFLFIISGSILYLYAFRFI